MFYCQITVLLSLSSVCFDRICFSNSTQYFELNAISPKMIRANLICFLFVVEFVSRLCGNFFYQFLSALKCLRLSLYMLTEVYFPEKLTREFTTALVSKTLCFKYFEFIFVDGGVV